MKYKNQLIVGSSILVIILAVFLGARVIGNTTTEDGNLGKSTISDEISDIADDGIIDNDKNPVFNDFLSIRIPANSNPKPDIRAYKDICS